MGVSNNNGIEVYELNKSTLKLSCKLSGHQKSLTDVVFSPREDHLLYSSGLDGLVKLWDLRASGSCVQEYKGTVFNIVYLKFIHLCYVVTYTTVIITESGYFHTEDYTCIQD